ncbi:hypothetical protein GCM10007977_070850 [Dactylosporangium sucinum]|uniref:Uncharacterized protein n=1 Tax=Dactylosporangium sucinum TaxID=1424081 RepID=A0A917X2Z9_9ACTN|nr:hypothetical protein GCM10007977_070850 [Dactylosporangium sucinum]
MVDGAEPLPQLLDRALVGKVDGVGGDPGLVPVGGFEPGPVPPGGHDAGPGIPRGEGDGSRDPAPPPDDEHGPILETSAHGAMPSP